MTPVEDAGADVYVAPGWAEAFLPRRDPTYLAAVAAVAVAAATLLVGAVRGTPALLPAMIGFAVLCALIGAGDAVTRRIPNKLNATALASAVLLLGLARLAGGAAALPHPTTAALGALAAFAGYFVLWLVAPSGMGLGDVKLAPYLGAYLGSFGWACWTDGIIYGFLIQGAVVVVALLAGKLGKKGHIAHGPAMCLGALVSLLLAHS